jgi:hypothetical protein
VSQNQPATIVRAAQPSPSAHKMPAANPKPAIVTTTGRKRRLSADPLPQMELPLSCQPVERDGDTYKRMKAAMTRRFAARRTDAQRHHGHDEVRTGAQLGVGLLGLVRRRAPNQSTGWQIISPDRCLPARTRKP